METFKVIGEVVPRVDGEVKAKGVAVFGADLQLPGMLHGRILRSPHPHAKVMEVDVTKARRVPGVVGVITGKDVPYLYGRSIDDQPFLAIDRVRHIGDAVAAVAAESMEAAEEAVEQIEVKYEELPAVFDVEEALKPEAPIIHEKLGEYRRVLLVYPVPGTNICSQLSVNSGDFHLGFRRSDLVIENRFYSPMVQHCYLEPKVSVAQIDPSGRICVWTSTQSPYRLAEILLRVLNISYQNLRIVVPYVGGGFGGKAPVGTEPIAIGLARVCGNKPVKVSLDREEEFIGAYGKQAALVEIKSGVKRDGTIVARKVRILWDTGAYALTGPTICRNASYTAAGPYKIPNVYIEGLCLYTNNVPSGSFRGYGVPQVTWAYESHTDAIAKELGMDPYEFRMKSIYEEGTKSATGEKLRSVGIKSCLERVAAQLNWTRKPTSPELGFGKKRGKGMACTQKTTASPSSSSAFVRVERDGTVFVITSGVEQGQGSQTTMALIASEVLGIPLSNIRVSLPDTDFTPYDESTTSSKFTFHGGNAVLRAATDARKQILEIARKTFKVKSTKELALADGFAFVKEDPENKKSIASLLTSGHYGRLANVVGKGKFFSDYVKPLDENTGRSTRPTAFWMYAAQGAEVEVDEETGEVRIIRVVAAHDVGKAINRVGCEQQIEGAVMMGIGQSLSEEMVMEKGKVFNASLKDYKVPTSLDMPEIVPEIVEAKHWMGPFGAKGMGEPALAPTAAAIANAVYDAVGVRIYDLPLTPEKVLRALKAKRHFEDK